MIAIVDYGMGNLRSVQKGFERVGFEAFLTEDPHRLRGTGGIVLPGVGAFGAAMERLNATGMSDALRDEIARGKPYLGICLGLQMLFESSEEDPEVKGLGLLRGTVVRFGKGLKVPHMGWNQLRFKQFPPHFREVAESAYVYFVHSYYVVPDDPTLVATTTEYGLEFTSSVYRENLCAMQFHPEKSQKIGLSILQAFGDIAR